MKIYKYHSINIFLLHSLRNNTNWYSRLDQLNDPYECFFIDKTNTQVFSNLRSSLYACCFSKNMNEILMWSHYADNHRGVCLEWEIDEEQLKGQLFEMKYSNEFTTIDEIKVSKSGHVDISIDTNGKFIVSKFQPWSYEEELRTYLSLESNKIGESRNYLGKLTAIYFGKNSINDDIDLVKFNSTHFQNLKYYKADLDTNTMKIDKIETLN